MAALAIPLIAAAIPAIAGLFGGKKQETKGTQDTSTHEESAQNNTSGQTTTGAYNGTQTATNVHNLSPLQQQLVDTFTKGAMDLNSSAADLSGYRNQGLQNINDASDAQNTVLRNTLAARGLSFSPAAGNAEMMGQQNRLNQQSSFLQGLPLLQRQLQTQAQQGLVSAFSALPTDSTQTGVSSGSSAGNMSGFSNTTGVSDRTGHTNQTGTVSGNPLAGFAGGLGAGLAAPNAQGTNSNGGSIIDAIAGMFGKGYAAPGSDLGGY